MKKGYIILFIMVALFSCRKEFTLEGSNSSSDTSGGGGSSSGSINIATCKQCVYTPMCDGSKYTYLIEMYGSTQTVTDTVQYLKDTTIDNKTFSKIFMRGENSTTYENCTNGEMRVIMYNATSTTSGTTVAKIDMRELVANLAVNGVWTDTIINSAGQTVVYVDSVKAKGVSRTVNSKNFSDVIHVYTEAYVIDLYLGSVLSLQADYYYAKGIGLIEAVISDAFSGTEIEHQTLQSWYIP
jgi:hypothetical protein